MTPLERLEAEVERYLASRSSGESGAGAAESATTLGRLAGQLNAARLDDLATVQADGTWALDGSRSAAAWLARQERSTKGSAGADLKTARLLADLPLTREAVAAGQVPVEHAAAITRTCLRTPAMREMLAHPGRGEAFLLSQAHLGLEDFRKFLNAWAARVDPEAVDAAYKEGRDGYWIKAARTSDGVSVHMFMSPVAGEGFLTMLGAEVGVPAKHDTRDTPQRLHDALAAIVGRVLDGGTLGQHASVRPQVVVHVPWVTLKAQADTAGLPPAWLQESGTPLPRRVLDRLACDCELTRVVFGPDGQVIDLGRSQRTFTMAQRRALDARDGGCRWPGCHAPPQESEGHHRIWWSRGGPTDVRDGLLACWFHHHYIHDNDVRIEHAAGGGLSFYDRHGGLIGTTYPTTGPDPDPLPWPDAA
jgi:hypothetical protein